MVSSPVLGTISTAIWLPFSRSKAVSLLSRADCSLDDNVPVRSVTCAFNAGTSTVYAIATEQTAASTATHSRRITRIYSPVPKSTAGGREISASFSTLKLDLVL